MGNSPQEKFRILIVEDDFDNQKFLQYLMKKYFDYQICDSSDSFYELFSKNSYDLIIMDISIKGNKNGLEITKELKSSEETKHIPVVVYTAHAFYKDRINAMDAGCDAYITKPSDIHVLIDTLFSLLIKKEEKPDFQRM